MERYIRFEQKLAGEIDVFCTDFHDDIQQRILQACGTLFPDRKISQIMPMPDITENGRTTYAFKLFVQ